ncbi:hypothetical protein Btru_077313 [Bulinus truncatus]|nr:hypothetical protein Btru_077313 [Bulinus truncatus]
MADPNLQEIPLPEDHVLTITHKKTAKEMLQEALKDHKLPISDVKSTAPGKLVTPMVSGMNVMDKPIEATSQSIVDELFKDFISQKFGSVIKDSHASSKISSKSVSVDDKISQILDMEINSIKSKTYNLDENEPEEKPRYTHTVSHKSSVNFKPNDKDSLKHVTHSIGQDQPSLNESSLKPNSSDRDITTSALSVPSRLSASVTENHSADILSPDSDATKWDKKGAETAHHQYSGMLPLSVVKKLGAPKLLKMKLSTESLSLIKSKDRMDRDGRVWEEGEVCSSHSDKSDKDEADDESDEHPSETGSIASNGADSHSSKRKHKRKHKHKKKKKKSSKEKSKEHKSKSKDDTDGYKDSSRSQKDRTHSHDGSSEREESGKRGKEKNKKRKKSRSRSRTPKRRKSRSQSRSRSPSRRKDSTDSGRHFNEWDARHYSDVTRHRSRSKEPSSEMYKRRSRERSRSEEKEARLQIDKDKLRRIAIANALQNMKSGQGPRVDLTVVKKFCKKISAKNKDKDECDSDESLDMTETKMSDDEDRLIHHPFKVKEPASSSIIMNIRNAKQLPVLTPTEKQAQQAALRLTFPVSSGSHHRANESEWVPVEKSVPTPVISTQPSPTAEVEVPAPVAKKPESIFPDMTEAQKLDISSIISERLQAVRKLQENPYDVQALTKMHKVQEQASKWATSKHLPGQFLGSTGAQVLSQQELMGDKKHQAWARKNQLMQAAPVNGGFGMFLLQKMGWKQAREIDFKNHSTP